MSWDTTNCTAGYAKDTLFPSSTPPTTSACDLNIEFFNAYVSVLLALQFVMLAMRTRFIVQHARKQKRKLVLSQYITITLTFIPLVTLLLMLILPNATASSYPQGNVMYLLFGVLLGVAQVNMIRWVWKLRRLGYKLIVRRLPNMKDAVMSATDADKTERLTIVLGVSSYFVSLAFVIVSCIAGMLVADNGALVQASFGLFGLYIIQMLVCGLNQTEHCCWLIYTTMHNVQDMIEPSMTKKYRAVLDKFRHQEMIMVTFGIAGIVLCILIAVGVIPAKQEMYLLFVTFDVLSAFSMMASILGYCCIGAFRKDTSSSQQQQQQLKTHSSKVIVLLPGTAEEQGSIPRTGGETKE